MSQNRLQNFLVKSETRGELERLVLTYDLLNQAEAFESILTEYLSGSLRQSRIPIALIERCSMADDRALKLGGELSTLFYDVQDHIGTAPGVSVGIAEYLKSKKSQEGRLDAVLADIKKRSGITISEDVLDRRFRTIVISWIRQVRDDIQTRQTALRETRVGGLGFTQDAANRFLDALKAVREEQVRAGTDLVALVNEFLRGQETVPTAAQDVEIDVQKKPAVKVALPVRQVSVPPVAPRNPVIEKIERAERIIESHKEIPAPKQAVKTTSALPSGQSSDVRRQTLPVPPSVHTMVESAVKNMPEEVKKENERVRERENKSDRSITRSLDHSISGPSIRRPIPESSRPKMADVRPPQKLYGPIEELGALSVADFRRLSADPDEAVRKLEHKLGLLEDESLTRRAEGIAALQKSPLYRSYAQRMLAAVSGSTAPGDLTDAELRAILKLNKTLKK